MSRSGAFADDGLSHSGQRYFFSVTGGSTAPLPQCVDLPNVREARREAVRLACEKMSEDPDGFWSTREWQLTVTDERGLNLFSLLIFASDAPAANGR